MAINASKCLCDIQNIPQIHWVILYDDLWEIEKNAKFDHFSYISTIWVKWWKGTKNDQILRFFNLLQIIIQYSTMYLGYILDVREAFGNIYSHIL